MRISRCPTWIAAAALDKRTQPRLLAVAALGFFVLWTLLLTLGKIDQTIHFDSAEAYAWGRQLAWGYGKHPPLSGAIAWLWFSIFPVRDWAMYALAMATAAATYALLWLLARRIVDRRRAMLMALLLFVYPILSFKGYKYNADLALMPFVVLVVLVFVIAFERRTPAWGIALGLAGAAAVLTKYWGAWPIVGIGCAALLHPQRRAFFRSPVPYVAAATFAVALIPHAIWLVGDDFEPFRYADLYTDTSYAKSVHYALTGTGQFLVLLVPMAIAAAIALGLPRWRKPAGPDPVRIDRARHIWVVVAIMAVLPQVAAAALGIRMKSDWGIPMFTMVPLAVVAWPGLTVPLRAIKRAGAVAAMYCAAAVVIVPALAYVKARTEDGPHMSQPLDELAQRLTRIWHRRYGDRLAVVAGRIPYAAPMTFYSPDHPQLFSEADPKLAPWIDTKALGRTGLLGLCRAGRPGCVAAVRAWRPDAQRIEIATRRHAFGRLGPEDQWVVLLAPPMKKAAVERQP